MERLARKKFPNLQWSSGIQSMTQFGRRHTDFSVLECLADPCRVAPEQQRLKREEPCWGAKYVDTIDFLPKRPTRAQSAAQLGERVAARPNVSHARKVTDVTMLDGVSCYKSSFIDVDSASLETAARMRRRNDLRMRLSRGQDMGQAADSTSGSDVRSADQSRGGKSASLLSAGTSAVSVATAQEAAAPSQLSAMPPVGSALSAMPPVGSQLSAMPPVGSQLSAMPPVGSTLSAMPPSALSVAPLSVLSNAA